MKWKNDVKDYATYKYFTDDYRNNNYDDDDSGGGCIGCLTFIIVIAFLIIVFTV